MDAISETDTTLLKAQLDDKSDAANTTFLSIVGSPEVKNGTQQAIEDLNKTVRDIRQSFRKIRGDLHLFDEQANHQTKLGPKWEKHYEMLSQILDLSHRNAVEAAAFMRLYARVMLQDVDEPDYEALKEELNNFRKKLDDKEKMALTTRDQFTRLAEDVRGFSIEIDSVLNDAERDASEKLDGIQQRIFELHVNLTTVSKNMTKLGYACLASLAVGAAAIGITAFTLSPDAMLHVLTAVTAAVGSGCAFLHAGKEKRRIKGELKERSEEMVILTCQHKFLQNYKKTLGEVKKEIYGLATKIDAIVDIWQSLRSDICEFGAQLELIADPDMKITRLFMKKVANSRELYLHLAQMLEQYAKGSVRDNE